MINPFHCAFHCVTQRRARFTVRFTAFHSAARVSLQAKVCRGKFPIINAFFPPLGFRQIVQHVQLHVA